MKKRLFLLIIASFVFVSSIFCDAAGKKRDKFVESAKAYMGVPYLSGGASTKGMDCSGFVYVAARDIGLSVPRSAAEMYKACKKISDSEREPGDLVFFGDSSGVNHVGIYIGNNSMINSASAGSRTGVVISSLSENYWKTHYVGAGRIIYSSTAIAKEDSSSKKSNNKSDAVFAFNTGIFFDWTFVDSEKKLGFIPGGGTLQAEFQLAAFKKNPGIMVRYTYPLQDASSFDVKSMINCFNLPVCLTLHLNECVSIYSGVVFSTGRVCSENQTLYGTDKEIVPNFYPGIFGITLQTPKFSSKNISLVQDLSFTCYSSADSSTKLSTMEYIAAGLKCSTGIQMSLPL